MKSDGVDKRARRQVARYFRSLGLRDGAVIRGVLRRLEEHVERRSRDDEEYDPEPLATLAVERVEDWIDDLCKRLGLAEKREAVGGFVVEEVSRLLGERPEWFLRAPEEMLARLKEAVEAHMSMFPHDDAPLEMPPHKLSDLPGILREDAWRRAFLSEIPVGAGFRRKTRKGEQK